MDPIADEDAAIATLTNEENIVAVREKVPESIGQYVRETVTFPEYDGLIVTFYKVETEKYLSVYGMTTSQKEALFGDEAYLYTELFNSPELKAAKVHASTKSRNVTAFLKAVQWHPFTESVPAQRACLMKAGILEREFLGRMEMPLEHSID